LDKIVDSVVVVENRKLNTYNGNFSDWWRERALRKKEELKRKKSG